MKKIFITTILSFFCILIHAQELTIKSFTETNDIVSGEDVRVDRNKKPCALIKLQVPLNDVKFEGTLMGEPVVKPGEYWLYVPQGYPSIRIKHASCLPLNFELPYGDIEKVVGNHVYVLSLALPATVVRPSPDEAKSLIINVSPSNAKVTIDGQPVRINGNGFGSVLLSRGEHTYLAQANGYAMKTGKIVIDDDIVDINIVLSPALSTLTVNTSMTYASILIDGNAMGIKKWTGGLTPGRHVVEVVQSGYKSYKEIVNIATGENTVLNIGKLEADARLSEKEGTVALRTDTPIRFSEKAPKTKTTHYDSGKLSGVYIEPAYQMISFTGAGVSLGAYISGLNIEAQYLRGMSESDKICWYTPEAEFSREAQYKSDRYSFRMGYGIRLGRSFQLTPQVGLGVIQMKETESGNDGNSKSNAMSGLFSLRCVLSLTRNIQIAITPEYSACFNKGKVYDEASLSSDTMKKWADGFNVRAGLSIMF